MHASSSLPRREFLRQSLGAQLLRAWQAWVAAVCLLIWPLGIRAADNLSARFDAANKLYEQGKYPEAIAAYHELIEQQQVSAALYFNLGNAFFKQHQLGQAIASYRLAQMLAPRDPDIRANLRFARESIGAPSGRGGVWMRWFNMLSVNELTVLTVVVVWLWVALLTAGQMRRSWARALRPYTMAFGIAVFLCGVWLGIVLRQKLGVSPAVVVARQAVVRYGPFDEAQRFYTLVDGAELRVVDQKDTWLQVTDASKRTGWLHASDVRLLPRG